MCLLFETIRIENDKPRYLEEHLARMDRSVHEIWGTGLKTFTEADIRVPDRIPAGVIRCNITYGPDIRKITFTIYEKRVIRSLKLISCNSVDYHLKFSDRKILESLFALRGTADEVLIVKDGLITDTSMSNIIFFDGTRWFTPSAPLLKGTCRERLVKTGFISEYDIKSADLKSYQGCKLINAMRYPEEEEMIPMTSVGW
ncbi:MAG: aminotransferase class IV [Bacteroidales bacterium]|nr:aminotransferase class IV [Bacteroidales bacterium]HNW72600.1 aminotransferase class IV [Bacteroidales bacterium]HPS49272.1 aminotransferase class IV [Bacteroidales bacterium]